MPDARPDRFSRLLGPAAGRLAYALGVVSVLLTLLAVSAAQAGGFGAIAVLVGWPLAVWFPIRFLVAPPARSRADVLAQVDLPWREAVQDAVARGRLPRVPAVRAAAADLARWTATEEARVRNRALGLTVVLLLAVLALLRATSGWGYLLPTVVLQLVVVGASELRLRRTAARFAAQTEPAAR